jgi:hypothetical protein
MATIKKISTLVDKLAGALVNIKLFAETEKKTHMNKAVAAIEKALKDTTAMRDAVEAKKTKKPKKLNDYMIFANKVRADVVKRIGPVPVTEVAREIGKMWRAQKAANTTA